ncbi:hypothetical protein BC833DRAFT_578878 [Globomyces pollinis-pini]|nr:hypothetical protein BC833DRAFT_578878 [Globomyces pollinis-pini]
MKLKLNLPLISVYVSCVGEMALVIYHFLTTKTDVTHTIAILSIIQFIAALYISIECTLRLHSVYRLTLYIVILTLTILMGITATLFFLYYYNHTNQISDVCLESVWFFFIQVILLTGVTNIIANMDTNVYCLISKNKVGPESENILK